MSDSTLSIDDLYSPAQLAALIKTSTNNLGQMRFHGTGPRYIKRGRLILYRRSDIEEWLSAGERDRTRDEPPGVA